MLVKKEIKNYDDYVNVQNRRGSINDSTLRYNNTIKSIFKEYDISTNDYILDIGTRNGQFIKELHENGYIHSYGTDISIGASALWSQWGEKLLPYFGIEDAQKSLTYFNKTYKFISLSHVLEHMYDVDSVLQNIKQVLDRSALVYIVVPCEDNVNHSAHYTSFPEMDDLVNLFTRHGYIIEKKWYNFSFQHELQILAKIQD